METPTEPALPPIHKRPELSSSSESLFDEICGKLLREPQAPFDDFAETKRQAKKALMMKKMKERREEFVLRAPVRRLVLDSPSDQITPIRDSNEANVEMPDGVSPN